MSVANITNPDLKCTTHILQGIGALYYISQQGATAQCWLKKEKHIYCCNLRPLHPQHPIHPLHLCVNGSLPPFSAVHWAAMIWSLKENDLSSSGEG